MGSKHSLKVIALIKLMDNLFLKLLYNLHTCIELLHVAVCVHRVDASFAVIMCDMHRKKV